jgi:hypothetical protein
MGTVLFEGEWLTSLPDQIIGENMTTQEERIKGLETQTGNIRERVAKIEGRGPRQVAGQL